MPDLTLSLRVRDRNGVRTVDLAGGAPIVGRALDNGIALDDVKASRQHCRLALEGGAWYVEDLGSRNGTRLNGKPLGRDLLRPGDRLQVGDATIEVVRAPLPLPPGGGGPAVEAPQGVPASGAFLTCLDGDMEGRRVPLGPTPVTLGRNPRNTVVLNHPKVSGEHARIEAVGAGYGLADQGSTNGTRVNGERVSRQVLSTGDVVDIEGIRFRYDGPGSSPARAPAEGGMAGAASSPPPRGEIGGAPPRPPPEPWDETPDPDVDAAEVAPRPPPPARGDIRGVAPSERRPDVARPSEAGAVADGPYRRGPRRPPGRSDELADSRMDIDVDRALSGSDRGGALAVGALVALLMLGGTFALRLAAVRRGPPADAGASGGVLGAWSFEKAGEGDSWAAVDGRSQVEEGPAADGSRALLVVPQGEAPARVSPRLGFAVEAGVRVRLLAAVRSEGARGVAVGLVWGGPRPFGAVHSAALAAPGDGFASLAVAGTPPPGVDEARVELVAEGGAALFDRIEVVPAGEPEPPLRAGAWAVTVGPDAQVGLALEGREVLRSVGLALEGAVLGLQGFSAISQRDLDPGTCSATVGGTILAPGGKVRFVQRVVGAADRVTIEWSTPDGAPTGLALDLRLPAASETGEMRSALGGRDVPLADGARADLVLVGRAERQVAFAFERPVELRTGEAEGLRRLWVVLGETRVASLAVYAGSPLERAALARAFAEAAQAEADGNLGRAREVYRRVAGSFSHLREAASRAEARAAELDALEGEARTALAEAREDLEELDAPALRPLVQARARSLAGRFPGGPAAREAAAALEALDSARERGAAGASRSAAPEAASLLRRAREALDAGALAVATACLEEVLARFEGLPGCAEAMAESRTLQARLERMRRE
ncbi:MAG: FHA domain-containing protein [Planctomycetes bacterium]|nr:FHA domain-containing protein [Planctomycetota bacterium]